MVRVPGRGETALVPQGFEEVYSSGGVIVVDVLLGWWGFSRYPQSFTWMMQKDVLGQDMFLIGYCQSGGISFSSHDVQITWSRAAAPRDAVLRSADGA